MHSVLWMGSLSVLACGGGGDISVLFLRGAKTTHSVRQSFAAGAAGGVGSRRDETVKFVIPL